MRGLGVGRRGWRREEEEEGREIEGGRKGDRRRTEREIEGG